MSSLLAIQPIQALEHPKYKEMIMIASRATDGIQIPSRKVARKEIISMWITYMKSLKKNLNVSRGSCSPQYRS